MKEVYLAYFDILGFKEFITNNDDNTLMQRMDHIFRDVETALSQSKFHPPRNGRIVPDISEAKINCLNISDTIVFWTDDCTVDSLTELTKVAYDFNWRQIFYNFPVRGALIKGRINLVEHKQLNENDFLYGINCLYGEGIVNAHLKAESQNWAGTVIDQSIIEDFGTPEEAEQFFVEYAKKTGVPYKNDTTHPEEFVFNFSKGPLNDRAFKNSKNLIIERFKADNKSVSHPGVQDKINNTIEFLESFKEI